MYLDAWQARGVEPFELIALCQSFDRFYVQHPEEARRLARERFERVNASARAVSDAPARDREVQVIERGDASPARLPEVREVSRPISGLEDHYDVDRIRELPRSIPE